MYSNGLNTENESTKDREDVKGQRNTMLIKKRLVKDSMMRTAECMHLPALITLWLKCWSIVFWNLLFCPNTPSTCGQSLNLLLFTIPVAIVVPQASCYILIWRRCGISTVTTDTIVVTGLLSVVKVAGRIFAVFVINNSPARTTNDVSWRDIKPVQLCVGRLVVLAVRGIAMVTTWKPPGKLRIRVPSNTGFCWQEELSITYM